MIEPFNTNEAKLNPTLPLLFDDCCCFFFEVLLELPSLPVDEEEEVKEAKTIQAKPVKA